MKLKLSIVVLPLAPRGPANSLFPAPFSIKRPQETQKKFVHFADSETTIGQLWTEIETAYTNKYLTQGEVGLVFYLSFPKLSCCAN